MRKHYCRSRLGIADGGILDCDQCNPMQPQRGLNLLGFAETPEQKISRMMESQYIDAAPTKRDGRPLTAKQFADWKWGQK